MIDTVEDREERAVNDKLLERCSCVGEWEGECLDRESGSDLEEDEVGVKGEPVLSKDADSEKLVSSEPE